MLNFNGVSGRGVAQIDNIFDESPLHNFHFEMENDGKLKNGDQAKIMISDDNEHVLHRNGYMLEEDFSPTFEVKGLEKVAEKATDIQNLADIERFMEEELNNTYQNTAYSFGPNTEYEIEQVTLMYRQFNKIPGEESVLDTSTDNHGNLIGIYAVKEYRISEEKELRDEFTAIYGFSSILLDEDNEANLAELKKINEQKGDNYSLESVVQLYEGEGYEEVKK